MFSLKSQIKYWMYFNTLVFVIKFKRSLLMENLNSIIYYFSHKVSDLFLLINNTACVFKGIQIPM